ncbi:MAG: YfhO family protein, partial [Sediminibacterium sp.]
VNYQAKSDKQQFAVFSEVYYNLGWKAYIDGVETPIVKTNYVLRGLVIPAGNHTIKFEFKPTAVNNAVITAGVASSIVWLLLAVIAFFGIKKLRENN